MGYVRWRTVGIDREEENITLAPSADTGLLEFLKGMHPDSDIVPARVPSETL